MNSHRFACLLLSVALGSTVGSAAGVAPVEPPALVVLISVDQLRGDYLERFRPHFSTGGFRLLLEQGAVFTDCHHQQSLTKTAPGHATMLTGVHPDVHGIIANDWLDRTSFARISSVGDDRVETVGLPPSAAPRAPGGESAYAGKSPRNLLAPTIGDQLKQASGGKARVFGVADKDRSAILMTGRKADAAYFMENGRIVTSTYYRESLPEWVEAWNAEGRIDACFGQTWDRLLPEAAYAVQGPDDAEGENPNVAGLGRTFPRVINGGSATRGAGFLTAFRHSPFSNEVITDFAEALIERENLGGRPGVTDLLCLGYSANDSAGHAWGPDSHEVMDFTVRTDRTLERFFRFLDQRVGLARCLIVLTSDHGVAPLPEQMRIRHPEIPAGRFNGGEVSAAAEQALNTAFGSVADGKRWLVRDDFSLLLFPDVLREKRVPAAAAQEVVRTALFGLDFVAAAYTREQLEEGRVDDDLGRRARLTFNRDRSGDVIFQAKPYFISSAAGTNHATPHGYDSHVPLIFLGAGVRAGVHPGRTWVSELAPTLGHLLGLPPLPANEGRNLL